MSKDLLFCNEYCFSHKLNYPMLIPLSVESIPDIPCTTQLCEHHQFNPGDDAQENLPENGKSYLYS